MFLELFFWILPILFLIYAYQLFRWPSLRTYRIASKIPGPKGQFLVGSALKFSSLSEAERLEYVEGLMNSYKRVMLIWVMGLPNVFLREAEDLEGIMSSSVHIVKGKNYEGLLPWLGEGLLLSTGKKWHSRRKMLTPAFHFRILENSLQTFNRNSALLTQKLLDAKGPVEIETYIRLCSLDALCDSAMGVALDAQMDKGKNYVNAVIRVAEVIKQRANTIWLLRDWMFYLSSLGKEFKNILKILHGFTDKVIEERKTLYKDNVLSVDSEDKTKTRKAFLDTLIEYEIKHPGSLTARDIREEVDTFMFEGHDTTSSSITFTLFLLGSYKDVQDKVAAELFEIFGDSDRPCESKDLQQMEYLEKVIKESLRIFPSVPLIARNLTQDLKLDGDLLIPAGCNVNIMPYLIHRNPRYFPDPEKFDPERFSVDENAKRHPFAYIPFSAGPRNCIGQKFALMEIKVIVSTILRRAQIESLTKREDFKLLSLLIMRPSVPIMLKFSPRTSLV